MAYRWETARGVWAEDEQSGQFVLESMPGLSLADWPAHAHGRLPELARWLGAALPGRCAHAAIYPTGFAFCPVCGAPLRRFDQRPPARAWWGPGADLGLPKHVPHGLPVTTLALAGALEARTAPAKPDVLMPAPPNSACVFAAADFGFAGAHLLALAHGRNVLQYWEPAPKTYRDLDPAPAQGTAAPAGRWQVMAPEDGAAGLAFTPSDYAWLPAATPAPGEVALVPTNTGLFSLFINPIQQTYRTEAVLQAPLLSAPGAVRKQIACLFLASGELRLWTGKADGADPEVHYCQTGPTDTHGWSAPLSYDGKLIWLHAQGHLIWQPGAPPQWLAWPAGWSPRRQFGGATQSRDGRLWLIGHDGQAYSFLELGVARGQQEAMSGARLGFASFLFRRGHPVINDPWDSERIEDPNQDQSLVLPLLQCFNGVRNQPAGLVLRFDHYTGKAEAALETAIHPSTHLEWIGQRNVVLDRIARLTRPGACLPFVHDGCLWLHHPDWDQMRGYRLEPVP